MPAVLITIVQFLGGVVLLVVGSDTMVRGATRLAARLGVPSLIIGLTVVAFGTSAPELAVSLQAAIAGSADIAVGNVVGSNIANVLLILGASAIILPLTVERAVTRLDVPAMIVVTLLLIGLALDGTISRLDGFVLLATLAVYLFWMYRRTQSGESVATIEVPGDAKPAPARGGVVVDVVLVAVGIAGLVVGSNLLVVAAVTTATALGVSQLVIGLTVVAIGTSLPELATSIAAAIKGERDIAVGNVVGSNVFNLLAVLGLSASTAGAIGVGDGARTFDFWIMLATSVACLPIFFAGMGISRVDAIFFLGWYGLYLFHQVQGARGMVLDIQTAVTWYVIPGTVFAAGTLAWHAVASRKAT